MREEPKIFGGGAPRPAVQGDQGEEGITIMGIEPDGAYDETDDYEYEYDDETADERPRRRLPLMLIAAAVAVVIGGVGAALLMGVGDSPPPVTDVRLITADPTPFKHRPDDPGGLEVPYQDVEVFGTLNEETAGNEDEYEVLLPEPEEPLDAMPEEVTVETGDDDLAVIDLSDTMTADSIDIVDADAGATMGEAVPATGVPPIPAARPVRSAAAATSDATLAETPTVEAADTASGMSFDDVAESLSGGGTSQPQAVSPATGGPKVQIAAYSSEQNALDAWAVLQGRHRDLLGGYQPLIDTAVLASGTFYRLQIGPFGTDAEARSLCDSLRGRQVDCVIVAP
jgi:SPOR domain